MYNAETSLREAQPELSKLAAMIDQNQGWGKIEIEFKEGEITQTSIVLTQKRKKSSALTGET
jgi:hypothetical protein